MASKRHKCTNSGAKGDITTAMISYFQRTCTYQYVARIHKHNSDENQMTRRTLPLPPLLYTLPSPSRHLHVITYECTPQNSSFLGLGSPKTGGPPGVELRTTTRSRSRPGLEPLLLLPLANGSSVGAAIGAMRRTLAGGRPTNRWRDHGSSYRASAASAT